MSDNKVKFGLENVYYAKITETNGVISYGTPVKIPGAVSLSADAEGDSTAFYADNIKYYVAVANNGYSGELKVAMIPDSFLTDILGETTDTNGAIIEKSDDVNNRFALMGEITGDVKKRRFIYYDCTATRPSAEMNTVEESKEAQTDKLSITMAARHTDNKIKAVIEPSETNKEVYDAFFTKVYGESI